MRSASLWLSSLSVFVTRRGIREGTEAATQVVVLIMVAAAITRAGTRVVALTGAVIRVVLTTGAGTRVVPLMEAAITAVAIIAAAIMEGGMEGSLGLTMDRHGPTTATTLIILTIPGIITPGTGIRRHIITPSLTITHLPDTPHRLRPLPSLTPVLLRNSAERPMRAKSREKLLQFPVSM